MAKVENIHDLLEKCYEEHSHEGEFKIFGKTIQVFKSEGNWVEEEDEGTKFCAFIDEEYWTGWYNGSWDQEEALRDVMEDVSRKVCEGRSLKFVFSGEMDGELNKGSLIKMFENNEYFPIKDLKITSFNTKTGKFKGSFILDDDYGIYEYFACEKEFNSMGDRDSYVTLNMKCEGEDQIREYFRNAFSYRTDLY